MPNDNEWTTLIASPGEITQWTSVPGGGRLYRTTVYSMKPPKDAFSTPEAVAVAMCYVPAQG